MTDRKAIQRILERLGFVHVAGWVRVEDAPAIRRKIEAAKADVENAKATETATLGNPAVPHGPQGVDRKAEK